MKKNLQTIFLFLLVLPTHLLAQPGALSTNELLGAATYDCRALNDLGAFRQVRVQAGTSSAAVTWEFPQNCAFPGDVWRPNTGGTAAVPFNTVMNPVAVTNSARYNSGNGGASGNLSTTTNGNYYTFNIQEVASGNNAFMQVLETTYNPADENITAVSQSPLAAYVVHTTPVTVTATTSAAPNANVYVRYTTNGWTTSSLVQLSFTGTTGTAVIPAQAAGTNVQYYIYSSPKTAAAIATDVTNFGQVAHDMATLNLNNNGGSNYGYSVLSGVVNVASTGLPANDAAYGTLKDAFDRINAGIHTDVITITITGNTTETAAAVLNASGAGSASYTAISIQPSGGAARSITGNIDAAGLITFNGADNVTIDGLNTGGNALTITNTSNSSTVNTVTILFTAAAIDNTVQNCTIEGSALNIADGVIAFKASNNSGNIIHNNTIKSAGTNLPINAIISTVSSSGVSITNNIIRDWYSNSSGVIDAGIYLQNATTGWTITGNHFFQSATRTATTGVIHRAIHITSGGNYTISNNTIGYANTAKTGVTTYAGAFANRFIGIQLVNQSGTSSIQNNEIAGITMNPTTSGAGTAEGIFTGIYVTIQNGSTVNIGTVTGNKIGVLSTGPISIAPTVTGGLTAGIAVNSTDGNCSIQNNTIQGWAVAGSTAALVNNFNGISLAGSINYTVSGNTIGHASTANAITLGNNGITTATCTLNGILNLSTGTSVISGNTIANVRLTTTTAASASINNGINQNAASGTLTISGNTVHSLGANSTNSTVSGITVTSGGTTNIAKNKIYGLNNNTGTAAIINGINVPATVGAAITLSNNYVGDLSATAITNSVAPGAIQGINLNTTGTYTINVYYNTVYLTGTATGTTAFGSAALYANTAPTVNVRNNIFTNLTTPKGTGRAVAYQRSSTTLTSYAATSNNNLWYAGSPSANNLIYFDGTNSDQTLANFQTRVATRDNASVSTDLTAVFLSTTGSNANYLHLNPALANLAESGAANIAGFTDDYDNDIRQGNPGYAGTGTAPDIGADEFEGLTCAAVPVLTSIVTPGPYYAGDVITINGSGLAGITIATINGVSASIGALTATTAQLTVPGSISVASGVILVSNTVSCGFSNGLAFTFGGYITKGAGAGTGNWNTATIWQGNAVPVDNSIVVINNGDAVTLNVSADPSSLTINATGSLTHQTAGLTFGATNLTSTTIAGTLILDNATTPVFSVANSFRSTTVTVQNGGLFTNNAANASRVVIANFTIDNGGTYIHNAVGSVGAGVANDLPGSTSRSFAASSTVEFRKWANGSTPVALPSVIWGNLIINVASLSGNWNMAGTLNTINGNFTIQQTGGGTTQFQTSTTTNYTLAVAGNISATGGIITFASSASYTLTVGGNVTANGGNMTFATGGGQPTVTISGGMTVQGSSTVIGNSSGVTNFNVANNVLVSGGSFTFGSNTITTNIGGNLTITNGTQSFASGGGSPTVTIGGTLSVQTGGTLSYGGSGVVNLTVGGDYIVSGGTVTTPQNASTINITGTQLGSTGSFLMSAGAYTPNTSSSSQNFFTIAGDMVISGGTFDMYGTSGTGTLRFSATINGTIPGTTGKLELSGSAIMRGQSSSPITITTMGNFTVSGTAQFIANNATSSGRNQVLNIGGNMNLGAGTTFTMTNTTSTQSVIRFIGGNTAEVSYTNNASTFSATGVDTFVVETGKTVVMNSDYSSLSTTSPDFMVRGTLDLCSDKIISGAGRFTLVAGATLKIGNADGITAALASPTGSIRTTATGGRVFPTTANYEYCGSAAQVTGTGLTGAAKLIINNTAGVTFNNSSIAVSDSLIFKAGILTLGTYNVSLPGPGRISGANSSRFVQTNSTGHLAITIPTTGLPVTVNYPVGSNNQYMPASYTFTANSTARDLQVRAVTPRNVNDVSTTDYINNRWWNTSLSNTSGNYTYTASYTYITGDVVGIPANIQLNRWNGTAWDYDPASSVNTGTLTLNSGTLNQATGSLAATAEWVGRAYRAPQIFVWTNPVNGSWLDASKWTPTGVPGSGDGVIFDKVGSYNVFQMPVGISLTQMHNTGSTLNLRAGAAGTVNIIPASAAPQFRISAGASTTLDSLNAVNLNLVPGATGTVGGSLNLQRTTHTATAINAGALVFPAGGYFSSGSIGNPGFSGNPFGATGTDGSVVFQNGSICESFEGANPFGNAGVNISTFQGGSLFRYSDPNPVTSPSLAGRTYANFEYNAAKAFSSVAFNNTFICDTLTVSVNSMAINAYGATHAIRGNIHVKTGASLTIATTIATAGTVNMNSGATQTIYGDGSFTVAGTSAGQTLNINAGTTVNLQKNMTVTNTAGVGSVTVNGTLVCVDENFVSGTGSVIVNAGATLSLQSINGMNNTLASGNIRSSGFTANTQANYIYSGSADQVTGNRLPLTLTGTGTLTIANTGTVPNNVVTLSANTTTPRLNLNNGQFNAGPARTLTIAAGGIVSGGGGHQYLVGAANDNIISFAANGAVQGTPELYNVTIGNSGGGVDFTNNARINGIFLINNLGSVNPNAPRYAVGSTLIYNPGGTYNRSIEWGTNTALAPSYPHHVIIRNGTTLNFTAATTFDVGCGGDLTIGAPAGAGNGTLDLTAMGANDLYVGGNINIGGAAATGSFTMSNTIGGDLYLTGNWTRTANGTVNFGAGNGRAVFFTGATNATITANGGQVFPFAYINKSTPATTLTLADHVSITDEISFIQGTTNLAANNRFITLISTAAKTARVGQSSAANASIVYGASGITGQFIIQRYMPARRAWRLMTVPIRASAATHTIAEAWQERGNGASGLNYIGPANTAASLLADTIVSAGFATHLTGGTTANGFDQSPTNSS
ncbi:MAG TPA: hypothetical protein PKC39_15815, partial [Ferruginibacter sp.]|nr:hypothetical protein [Ferruginibacter sp.]